MSERKQRLLDRLQKGIRKTEELFRSFEPAQWEVILYRDPYPWTLRDLLAHFLSAEVGLLYLARDIAAGGRGAPEGFDLDAMNATEQDRLVGIPPEKLMTDLIAARQRTIQFVEGLEEEDLDRTGYHPALGKISLETFIDALYGHQLLHVRDLKRVLDR